MMNDLTERGTQAVDAVANVIPLRKNNGIAGYAPGVVPFDGNNPDHVRAWNTLFTLGWSEQRFRDKERFERPTSLECVK